MLALVQCTAQAQPQLLQQRLIMGSTLRRHDHSKRTLFSRQRSSTGVSWLQADGWKETGGVEEVAREEAR